MIASTSQAWSAIDKAEFGKFVIDTANEPFTLDDEQEMKQYKMNEGMFLGIKFSRKMTNAIIEHHKLATVKTLKASGIWKCVPRNLDGFCPFEIRRKLLPFMRKDKLSVKHENRTIEIPDEIIDSVKLEINTTGRNVVIGLTNTQDPTRDRAYHEFPVDIQSETEEFEKEEIDSQIIGGFIEFVQKVVLFVDQDRLARYM